MPWDQQFSRTMFSLRKRQQVAPCRRYHEFLGRTRALGRDCPPGPCAGRRPTHWLSLRCDSALGPSANPWARIGRRQLVRAHALRCGASRQPLVQALGNALHELAAVGLGWGQRASVLLFRCCPRLEGVVRFGKAASTVSPSAMQPGRSGTITRKPPPSSRGSGSMRMA